jgi:hypothetical protein
MCVLLQVSVTKFTRSSFVWAEKIFISILHFVFTAQRPVKPVLSLISIPPYPLMRVRLFCNRVYEFHQLQSLHHFNMCHRTTHTQKTELWLQYHSHMYKNDALIHIHHEIITTTLITMSTDTFLTINVFVFLTYHTEVCNMSVVTAS